MPTYMVPYAPATGRAKIDLTSWAGTLSFSVTPVAGDQLEYNSALTVLADGTYSGPAGTYTFHLLKADGNIYTAAGTIAASDTTPPTLSNATAVANSATQVTASVATDELNGTMYAYISINAVETATTIKTSGSSSAVSASPVQFTFTGLTASTSYYVHFVHVDAATNESNVLRTAGVVTPAAGESATTSLVYAPPAGMDYTELVPGFETYVFEEWPAGEPDVGWQLAFDPLNFVIDQNGNITTDSQSIMDVWVVDLNGIVYKQVVGTTGLNTTAGTQITSVVGPTAGTYTQGMNLDFTVNYGLAVTVTGTPRIPITLASGQAVYADYVSGTGTTALLFRKTVAAGEEDLNGIAISDIDLNGGTLTDSNSDLAGTVLSGVSDLSAVLVDAKAPVGTLNGATVSSTQPQITGTIDDPAATIVVSPGSVSATNNGDGTWTLAAGLISALSGGLNSVSAVFTDAAGNQSTASNIIEVIVTNVTVVANDLSTADTTPVVTGTVSLLPAVVKVTAAGVEYTATLSGNNWSAEITQPLPLGATVITANAVASNGTTASDTATITIVDVTGPSILAVTPPAAGTYTTGAFLEATVQFNETVVVTGTPRLPVIIGATTQYMDYVSGTNTDTLTFRYVVASGDEDQDEISLTSLQLNGGTIRDQAANDATVSFAAVTTVGVVILTVPAVLTVDSQTTINSAPILSGTSTQQNISLTVQVAGVTYTPAVDANGVWKQQIGSLAVGLYTVTANAVNIAGLVSVEATATLSIELPEELSDPNEPDRLTDAILLLKRRLGRYTDNPTALDSYILPELVAAQNRLENKTSLPWFMKTRTDTIQTTPGQERIVKPYDWIRIREDWEIPVQIKVEGQWRRLGVYNYEQFWDNTSDTPGVPEACAQDGQDIVLGPPPAAVYPVRLGYYKREYKLVENKVTSNAWLKYAFDLIVSEAGFILANNYLKNQEAAAQFAAEIQRAESDLRMTTIAYETAAMESWELRNGR